MPTAIKLLLCGFAFATLTIYFWEEKNTKLAYISEAMAVLSFIGALIKWIN